jgi:DNA-binding LacI/PurR family transcriptional regulator
MRDVADRANVSVSAVWMAIHNKPGIKLETSKRIWEVIGELGYTIQSNGTGNEKYLGLVVQKGATPAFADSFYAEIIRGFQTEAEKFGYQMSLITYDQETATIQTLRHRLARQVAGFVVANDGDITPSMVLQLKATRAPIVLVENHIDDQQIPCVLGDNLTAGYMATKYLLDLGHRNIAVLPGPSKYSSLVDRLRGCRAALAEAGILIRPTWMPPPLSGHPLKGYVQMREILNSQDHPTAVVAISDKTAIGAMEALREYGYRIPDDISIIGIDNTVESEYSRPPLTTVHVPKYEMGVLAFHKLHVLIEHTDKIPVKTIVYSHLVVRESCKARG